MYISKVNHVRVRGGELSWTCDVCVSSCCAAALILQGPTSAPLCSFPRQLGSHLNPRLVLKRGEQCGLVNCPPASLVVLSPFFFLPPLSLPQPLLCPGKFLQVLRGRSTSGGSAAPGVMGASLRASHIEMRLLTHPGPSKSSPVASPSPDRTYRGGTLRPPCNRNSAQETCIISGATREFPALPCTPWVVPRTGMLPVPAGYSKTW